MSKQWAANKRITELRSIDRTHFYEPERLVAAYRERRRLLRLLCDWDFKKGQLREGKEYDEPTGGWRAEPRKCSWCNKPTNFTTARGRSVHPACEGWVDDLTSQGEVELMYAVMSRLGVKSVEEE